VVSANDTRRIAAFRAAAGSCTCVRTVPGLDHDFQRHPSCRASYRDLGRGAADAAAAAIVVDWMRDSPGRRRAWQRRRDQRYCRSGGFQ
jgi:hypothetical protein